MTRSTDSWIQQIASSMGQFYQLLAKMQYLDLDKGTIDYAPHTDPKKCVNTVLAAQLGLTPEAIKLLQRLPYVAAPVRWNHGAGDNEFILRGCFADFRSDQKIEESRDPLYASVDPKDKSVGWDDKDGQYMQPWYVPLSRLGNHGVVLILNMKNRESVSICLFSILIWVSYVLSANVSAMSLLRWEETREIDLHLLVAGRFTKITETVVLPLSRMISELIPFENREH